MYCQGCGVHAPEDANFCVSCGEDLRDLGDVEDSDTEEADEATPTDPTVEGPPRPTADDLEPVRGDGAAEELLACPACGSPNSPNRYLCGRCGADLASGDGGAERTVVPSPSSGARPRRLTSTDDLEGRSTDRGWQIAAGIVALGIVVGGALGAMVAFEAGPFASAAEPDSEAPVFDRAAYPDSPEDLTVTSVAASTAQTGTADRFDASQLLDGDLTTAWNSRGDVNPDGVGEIVEVDFGAPVWLSQVVFANGDQQDDQAYVANARAKRVEVSVGGGSTFIVNLLDEPGEQAVRLPVPRLTSTVRFEVLEVYPGDTYDDLGLSELRFRGFPANAADAEVAEAR